MDLVSSHKLALPRQPGHRRHQPVHRIDALLEGGTLGGGKRDLDDPLDAGRAENHRHAVVVAADAVLLRGIWGRRCREA